MQTTTTGPIEAILTEYRHVRETPAPKTADADASNRHDNAIIDRLTELTQTAASMTPGTNRQSAGQTDHAFVRRSGTPLSPPMTDHACQ